MEQGIVYAAGWTNLDQWYPLFVATSPDYATSVSFDGHVVVGVGGCLEILADIGVSMGSGVLSGSKLFLEEGLSSSVSEPNVVRVDPSLLVNSVGSLYFDILGGLDKNKIFCVSHPDDKLWFCDLSLRKSMSWDTDEFFVCQLSFLPGSNEFFYPSVIDSSFCSDDELQVAIPLFDSDFSIVEARTALARQETYLFWGADRMYRPFAGDDSDLFIRVNDSAGRTWRIFGDQGRVVGEIDS